MCLSIMVVCLLLIDKRPFWFLVLSPLLFHLVKSVHYLPQFSPMLVAGEKGLKMLLVKRGKILVFLLLYQEGVSFLVLCLKGVRL